MPAADDILTLAEVSAALRLDPRTVRRVASRIGGRRIGNRWRFRWGTVMEFFDAYANQSERQRLAGKSNRQRQGGGQQTVSAGPEKGAGMARGTTVGGVTERGIPARSCRENDPHGLRAARGLG